MKPAVKTDCTGLEASVYVCIGLNGPATTITSGIPVAVASATATAPPELATPTPVQVRFLLSSSTNDLLTSLQAGMVSGCMRFYYVESGDGCDNLASEAGIALA